MQGRCPAELLQLVCSWTGGAGQGAESDGFLCYRETAENDPEARSTLPPVTAHAGCRSLALGELSSQHQHMRLIPE